MDNANKPIRTTAPSICLRCGYLGKRIAANNGGVTNDRPFITLDDNERRQGSVFGRIHLAPFGGSGFPSEFDCYRGHDLGAIGDSCSDFFANMRGGSPEQHFDEQRMQKLEQRRQEWEQKVFDENRRLMNKQIRWSIAGVLAAFVIGALSGPIGTRLDRMLSDTTTTTTVIVPASPSSIPAAQP